MLFLPGLEIYPGKRKVFRDRQEIQLTVKEYEILLLLTAQHGACAYIQPNLREGVGRLSLWQ